MCYSRDSGVLCVDSVIFLLAIHGCFWRMACVWYRGGADWRVCVGRSFGVVEVVVAGGGVKLKFRRYEVHSSSR